MTIPSTPLVVKFDPDEMTLDELCLFEPGGFSATGLRAFLAAHTRWSRTEIGNIRLSELREVAEQLAAKIKEITIPLAR
jgi:hypothetical protein